MWRDPLDLDELHDAVHDPASSATSARTARLTMDMPSSGRDCTFSGVTPM
jgi:hypothetical protein